MFYENPSYYASDAELLDRGRNSSSPVYSLLTVACRKLSIRKP